MSSSDYSPFSGPRVCPRCRHPNGAEMAFCISCGSPLDRASPADHVGGTHFSASSPMPEAEAVGCPACKLVSPPGAKACECGWNFVTQAIQAPETETDLPRRRESAPMAKEQTSSEGKTGWSYAVGREVRGPFSEDQMAQKLRSGEIQRGTLVWNVQCPGWIEARASTLASHFLAPPPLPQSATLATAPRRPPASIRGAASPAPQDPTADHGSLQYSSDDDAAVRNARGLALSAALLSIVALLTVWELGDASYVPTPLNQLVYLGRTLVLMLLAVTGSFWSYEWLTVEARRANGKARLRGGHVLIGGVWTAGAAIFIHIVLQHGSDMALAKGQPVASSGVVFFTFVVLSGMSFVAVMTLARLALWLRPAVPLTASVTLLCAWQYWHLLRRGWVTMEVFLIAVLIGLIPAVVAQRKGRSFMLWWAYGGLLFIAAMPHSLLLKPDAKAIERRGLSGGLRKCPSCAELIKAEAIVCRFCGRDVLPTT